MQNPYSKSDILRHVKGTLARVLGVSEAEIHDDSSMVNDLGAESLDFVELNSLLEKSLNITLPTKSVLLHAGKISGHPELFYNVKSGLTEEGVRLLAHSPYRYERLHAGISENEIFNTSAAINLAGMCHEILNHLPASCPDCGHERAVVSATGKPVCAACSVALRPLKGDDVLALHVERDLAQQISSAT